MSTKERSQNPVVGDKVKLRLYTYNGNQRRDVSKINSIDLYFLDPNGRSEDNPDGRVLIDSISYNIEHPGTGEYCITVPLDDEKYVIGKYIDLWHLHIQEGEQPAYVEQKWQILPPLWYTSPEPMIYDFSFGFRPNRIRAGAKRYLQVEIRPNVPNGSALEQYYINLAAAGEVKISIEMACSDCLPPEQDLRMIVENKPIEIRGPCEAYYFLDTIDLELECGLYNVWFEMDFGENRYISDKQQLEIFS